jgi:7,8-dihydropterin-6-yl-methyl-4-(beta-D-ribofuranosyl)aminobenzene 5'-phosphate synthase
VFVEHAAPAELLPGVWFTGPVPRKHPERNWSGNAQLRRPSGLVEDNLPEDSSIVIETAQGLIVVTGCGHAGIVNIVEYAQRIRGAAKVLAVIGGLHLFQNTDDQLAWTGRQLRAAGVAYLLGAHCTGIEAVFRLRAALGLARATAVVGMVGASFTLGTGIDPLALAR